MTTKKQTGTNRKLSGAAAAGPGPGRKKGVPNKVTTDVRQMVLAALEGVGGQQYLQTQARNNPNAFLALVAKTMPTKVIGDPDNPVGINVAVSIVGDMNAAIAAGLKS